jgi:hypothetical protein
MFFLAIACLLAGGFLQASEIRIRVADGLPSSRTGSRPAHFFIPGDLDTSDDEPQYGG